METPATSRSFKRLRFSTDIDPMPGQVEEDQNPPGSIDDERKLLNIFPEEIWMKILASVNRPHLESVNNATPFFRRLLYPDRTTFLFSSVWKVLGVQYEHDADPVYCDLELEDSDLNYARLEGMQPVFSVILKLRLVCKEWCLAVDKFYEDLYSYDTKHSVHNVRVVSGLDSGDEVKIKREYQDYYTWGHWTFFKFMWEEEVQDFMEHFMPTHDSQKNPFPFRKVIFCAGDLMRDNIIEYCSRVIQLLTKYGHHIWFCEIETLNEVNSQLELLIKIQEMLTLMPNLKVLRFCLSSFHNSDPEMTELEEQLKQALVAHPVPKFESLRMLSFWSTTTILMEHILETNDHVVKVEMKCGLKDLDFAEVPLPNLTQLAVCLDTTEDFEELEQCGHLWKLEMLHLGWTFNADYIPHSRIFKCLEQWKTSLTDVVVSLPLMEGEEIKAEIVQNSEMRLDLPSVKRLRIRMFNIRSLDLILPMRNSLELLEYSREWKPEDWETIPTELKDELKRKEMIQFHSVRNDDMYNSNIWSLFPKLGRIHVYDDWLNCYNRPAYIRMKWMALED